MHLCRMLAMVVNQLSLLFSLELVQELGYFTSHLWCVCFQDVQQRFVQLVNQIYDPALEEHWAQISNVLLLKVTCYAYLYFTQL